MNKKIIIGVGVVISLAALAYLFLMPKTKNPLAIDVSQVSPKIEIRHFDDALFQLDTLRFQEELKDLFTTYEPFFSSTQSSKFWYDQRVDPLQTGLYQDWKKLTPDYEKFDKELTQAFRYFYHYYPSYPPLYLYTYISRLDFAYPVLMADSYFFIATDLYLGPKSKYYDGMPEYLKYFRQKEFISTEIMERIAFNLAQKDPNDNTLLNDMIWWGKVMYFEQAMQPLEPDSVIARYSGKHLLFAIENEMAMWTYFVDNKLLFDSNAELKRKFIEPAPYSKFGMPFDNETPGVIGRWMGWRIVSSYMRNNPEIKLPDLMSDTDYKSIFKNSKYKP